MNGNSVCVNPLLNRALHLEGWSVITFFFLAHCAPSISMLVSPTDICREADGELLDSGASVCGFVLLRLHERLPLCLIKVQMLPLSWLPFHTYSMLIHSKMTTHYETIGTVRPIPLFLLYTENL